MTMTRVEFIQLVKDDQRAQIRQVVWLMGAIATFGGVTAWLAKRWEEQLLDPGQPYLWLMCGLAMAFVGVAVAVVRIGNKSLLKCVHCRKCLGGFPAQVVVASGRCGFCGQRILDEN